MIKELIKFDTKINRKQFFILLISLIGFIFIVHYSVYNFYNVTDIETQSYFILKSIFSFIYFLMFLPFAVARLKDAGLSPYWALILFVSTIFDFRNIILAQVLWGVVLDPFSTPLIVILALSSFILLLILLFKKST